MTDVKPFAHSSDAPPAPRTVAVVLLDVFPPEFGADLLEPLAGTTLLDLSIRCLAQVVEAEQRFVLAPNPAVYDRAAAAADDRTAVIRADSGRRALDALLADPTPALKATHVLRLSARHPFLRPSTVDEAIRLFRMRYDIVSLISSVPQRAWVAQGTEGSDVRFPAPLSRWFQPQPMAYRLGDAFELVERASLGEGGSGSDELEAYRFEVSPTEGFRVDGDFARELAAAKIEHG